MARSVSRADYEHVVRLNEVLRATIERMRSIPDDSMLEGCGDNSCLVRSPKGMATNGGCRCDERRLRRAMQYWKARAIALEAKKDGR